LHCFLAYFHQYHLAVEFVKSMMEKYSLNPKLCGLESKSVVSLGDHQHNFLKMIHDLKFNKRVEIYFAQGRKEGEKGFVWIENSMYKGYGFVEESSEINLEVLTNNLTLRMSSVTSEAIVRKLRDTNKPAMVLSK
jgi:hypothetical protein